VIDDDLFTASERQRAVGLSGLQRSLDAYFGERQHRLDGFDLDSPPARCAIILALPCRRADSEAVSLYHILFLDKALPGIITCCSISITQM